MDTIEQNAWFYALRPEWLDSDQERAEFAAKYPDLVERNSDCWEDYINCLPVIKCEEQ